MATLQLMPTVTTINGTTFATAQLILPPSRSPQRRLQSKAILPKQEPASPVQSPTVCERVSPQQQPLTLAQCTKTRIHFSKKALSHPRPHAVTRRNTRERNRVSAVNQGKENIYFIIFCFRDYHVFPFFVKRLTLMKA